MADDFADMTGRDDSGKPAQAVMWIRSTCINGIELALLDAMRREPLLPLDVEFLDGGDDTPAPEDRVMENPELSAVRHEVSMYWLELIGLARSLGERAKHSDFLAACEREGITPPYLDPVTVGA